MIAAALLAPPSAAIAADAVELPATSQRPRTQIPLERALPFFYEANRGQAPDGWDFLVRCTGYHAFVRSDEAVFSFDGAGLSLALDGARRVAPDVRGLEMKAHANYFIGNDPTKWISDVPLSRGAVYRDVAPGTTWRLGASGRRLEFSLVVPGTDEPRFRLAGARTVTVGGDGTLRIAMPTGEATFTAPVAWQLERSGARHTVTARYVVEEDGEFRIALGERDAGRKTFVDPTVSYESYLGGKGDDYVGGAAIDAAGGAYLAGSTLSSDFPTTAGAYDPTPNSISAGRLDAYVVKLSSSGGSLSYATFLGSATKDDIVNSLQVNASGNAFLAGVCYGSDYPTTAGVVAETHTAQYSAQGFVSKLSASGASLAWSTYAPGMGAVEAMAVGPDGSPHLIDGTQLQRLEADASATSFVAEPLPVVDTAGGAGFLCVAVDAADNAFVSGYTSEPEPTASMGAYASPHLGKSDVFVLKMDPNGNVVWSARFGGSLGDNGYAIGVDLHGRPTVTGETTSMDLDVTPDAFQSSRSSKSAGDHDGFLVRLSADGSRLRYSTYFGGNGADVVSCLQVHPGGAAFVAGYTKSTNLPVSGGFQTTYGGGTYDAYILKFTSTGALAWASYVGGAGIDDVLRGGLGAGPDGTIVLGLHTESSDFPTVSPFQSKLASTGDCAFVSVPDNLALSPSATEIVTATLPQWTAGLAFSETLKATGGATPYTWKVHSGVVPPGLTLTTGGSLAGTPSGAGTSTFVVRLTDANDYVEEREFTVRVNPVPTFVAATVPEWTAGVPMDVTLPTNGGTGALVYTVAAGTMPSGLVLTSDGHILGTPADGGTWPYTVKVTDALGVATTKQFTQRVNVRPTIVAQTLPDWTSGRPLETAFATSGGTPPFTWGVSSGQTPAALDSGSGRFSGPARAPRLYAFTLSATDARDVTVTRQFEQAIHAFPAVVTAALPIAAAGRPFRIRLTARDGSAPLVWGHDSGKLPDEVDLDAATGILQGTPSAAVAPTTLVLSVTDASGAHATAELPFECVEGADLSKRRTSAAITLIPGAPTSIRRFIELTLGCTIDVKVTGGIGTDAHPSLRILRADGEPLDLDAGLTATKRDVRLRNLLITETGRYFVAVDAAPGATGVMKVALSITPRSSWTATVPVSTELPDALVRFAAPRGARATAVVKPARNSRARPQLAAWTGADDESLLPGARIRKSGRSVTVSLGRTLDGGDSVLHLAASPATDAGLVVVSIRLKLPKKYSFSLLGVAAGDEP